MVAARLLPAFCETLDSYRAFTVLYDSIADGDKELALHYDNAEVTLNINIGGTWGGGNVVYYGLATNKDDGKSVEAKLRRGWGVFHAGLELLGRQRGNCVSAPEVKSKFHCWERRSTGQGCWVVASIPEQISP